MRPKQAALTLPPDLTSAAHARRFITRTLRAWRVPALREAAELLASELVANAIRHSHTDIEIRLRLDGRRLTIEVSDCGPGHPRPRLPTPESEDGRGLYLVDHLARDWGVRRDPEGKTVWAALEADLRQSVRAG
jgi:anti-sigma regulatory factor (Ser/Thr protein kinase)